MDAERRKGEFRHIGGIIDRVLKDYRHQSDQELLRVWDLWDSIVGEEIAGNTKPAAFKGDLLLVFVSSSTWLHQLQFLKTDIIDKINDAFGDKLVRDIRFKIGSS